MAKLVSSLLATAALWVRIQTSLKVFNKEKFEVTKIKVSLNFASRKKKIV